MGADALRDFRKPRLANYKTPKSFSFEALPLPANSKIDKQALKARLADLVERAACATAQAMAAISGWK